MQITYQKKDGCIIKRLRKSLLPYKIGEETSMGWKVLNIEYEYKNKFYPEYKYHMLIHKDKCMCIKRQKARELYIQEIKTFLYCILAILLVTYIKELLGF